MRSRLRTIRVAATEGRGVLTTVASLVDVDRSLAQGLLPRGLALDPRTKGPARALLLMSRCHFSAWFGEMNYLEMTLGVADVATGEVSPGLYFRRLYLGATLPRLLGNFIYGWEKAPARLEWEGEDPQIVGLARIARASTWRITSGAGTPILTAVWREADVEPKPADASALFAVLDQPVLSQAARRWSASAALDSRGPFLRTRIATARPPVLRRLVGDVCLEQGFDPPALAGVRWPAVQGFLLHTTQVVGLPKKIDAMERGHGEV